MEIITNFLKNLFSKWFLKSDILILSPGKIAFAASLSSSVHFSWLDPKYDPNWNILQIPVYMTFIDYFTQVEQAS